MLGTISIYIYIYLNYVNLLFAYFFLWEVFWSFWVTASLFCWFKAAELLWKHAPFVVAQIGVVTSTSSILKRMDSCNSIPSYPFDIIETCFLGMFSNITIIRGILVFPPFFLILKNTTLHKVHFRHDVACSAYLCCLSTSSTFTIHLAKCQMGRGPEPTVEGTTRGHCTVQVACGNDFLCLCACWKLGGQLHHFFVKFYKKE